MSGIPDLRNDVFKTPSGFKFEVGQEVMRVDSTGAPWGAPVVITHRNVLSLPAHKLCEIRYMFTEGGYSYEVPESSLRAWVNLDGPPAKVTDADLAQMVARHEKPKPGFFSSWWRWLFHD